MNRTIKGAKPFVKWAGGKTQLLADIAGNLPDDFRTKEVTYVEPFVGGGSVVFWILQRFPNIKKAVINDINSRLINVYRTIKEEPKELINVLHFIEEEYLPKEHDERTAYFMEQRRRFNDEALSDVEQAALFIFLNRTCFNGLYRENTKGKFNVPHGRYAHPTICDEETIMADSALLQKVEILCGDFAITERYAGTDTLFYFDPPYKPLSNTSSFNTYVKEPFDDAEQVRLRNFCNTVAQKGSRFILSNSDVKGKNPADNFFDDLYSEFTINRVFATRMVNANPDKRGKLTELMISNINNKINQSLFELAVNQ
ncbi:MAG: DNA adenine methylase [Bacteroidaceae bacterium]|nr:DNA adenine methylase [Bacteroidaceae bacterium]